MWRQSWQLVTEKLVPPFICSRKKGTGVFFCDQCGEPGFIVNGEGVDDCSRRKRPVVEL